MREGNVFTSVRREFYPHGRGVCLGVSSQGVPVKGVSAQGCLPIGCVCLGGVCLGVSAQEGVCLEDVYLGGVCPRGVCLGRMSAKRGVCLMLSAQEGDCLPEGFCPGGGCLPRGCLSAKRVSVWGCLSRGCLSRWYLPGGCLPGVSAWGCLPKEDVCPGGVCLRRCLPTGVSAQRNAGIQPLLPVALRDLVNKWAVRILLECILVENTFILCILHFTPHYNYTIFHPEQLDAFTKHQNLHQFVDLQVSSQSSFLRRPNGEILPPANRFDSQKESTSCPADMRL